MFADFTSSPDDLDRLVYLLACYDRWSVHRAGDGRRAESADRPAAQRPPACEC